LAVVHLAHPPPPPPTFDDLVEPQAIKSSKLHLAHRPLPTTAAPMPYRRFRTRPAAVPHAPVPKLSSKPSVTLSPAEVRDVLREQSTRCVCAHLPRADRLISLGVCGSTWKPSMERLRPPSGSASPLRTRRRLPTAVRASCPWPAPSPVLAFHDCCHLSPHLL